MQILKNRQKTNINIKTNANKIKQSTTKQVEGFKLTNFLRSKYISICKKIFLMHCKTSPKTYKIIKNLLDSLNKKNKDLFSFWFYEMYAAHYIFKNIKNKTKYIYLTDEGFIQRSFLILHSSINNKIKFLKNYFDICPKPDFCIYLTRKKKLIYNTQKLRKINQKRIFLERYKISEFIKFEKIIYDHFRKKIPHTRIQSDNNIDKKIINLKI